MAPAGIKVWLRRPPCEWGNCEVQNEMRAGAQSGCGVIAFSKSTPSAARRSMDGVWQKVLP